MVAAAAIGAVVTVAGAGATIVAGNKAASATKKGAQLAADTSQRQYDQTREDYGPYRQVGYGALGKLAGMYGVTPTDVDGKPWAASLLLWGSVIQGTAASPLALDMSSADRKG